MKALRALEVMKSCHDFDSILSVELLSTVWSITAFRTSWGFWLEWSAHAKSNVPPYLGDTESSQVGRLKGILSSSRVIRTMTEQWLVEVGLSPASRGTSLYPRPPPPHVRGGGPSSAAPAQPAVIPSSPLKVQEIRPEETTQKITECSRKRLPETTLGPRKKAKVTGRHKSHHEVESSKNQAVKGKESTSPVDEASTPRSRRPKLVRELCNAQLGVDGRDYHVVRMSSLLERDTDAPLELALSPLMHGTRIWQDRGSLSKVCAGGTDSPIGHRLVHITIRDLDRSIYEDYGAVHDAGRVISAMDNKADGLHKEIQELKTSLGSDAVVAVEQWASEAQSLVEHYKTKLEEPTHRRESLELELSDSRN
ncbi:hypothetical protein BHM03_00001888 [Ensete ventricosum]|nr:hypothetical protein BHM03_00001888 [Ensete ventricosum]